MTTPVQFPERIEIPPSRRTFLAAGCAAGVAVASKYSFANCGCEPMTPPTATSARLAAKSYNYTLLEHVLHDPQEEYRVPDAGAPSTANAAIYQSIDLMCYLTIGVPYSELYGDKDGMGAKPVTELISEVFIPRLQDSNHIARYMTTTIRDKVVCHLSHLHSELGSATTTFADVYSTPVIAKLDAATNPEVAAICVRLHCIRSIHHYFCFPFIAAYKSPDQLKEWSKYYGCFSLYKLCTRSKESSTACDGSDWSSVPRILGMLFVRQEAYTLALERRDTEHLFEITDSQKCDNPNNYCCDPGSGTGGRDICSAEDYKFCSLAEDGYCSLISCC